jgi:hypothetical protein
MDGRIINVRLFLLTVALLTVPAFFAVSADSQAVIASNEVRVTGSGSGSPSSMRAVLKNIELCLLGLALVGVQVYENETVGYYIPTAERETNGADGRTPNDLCITIWSYNSDDCAQQGLESNLGLRQMPPNRKEEFKGVTLHRWSAYDGIVVCRIGRYVVDVTAIKESAKPLVMKALENLIQELGTGSALTAAVVANCQEPIAGFYAGSTYGTEPLMVTFTDASRGSITNWSWDFGDGHATNLLSRPTPCTPTRLARTR